MRKPYPPVGVLIVVITLAVMILIGWPALANSNQSAAITTTPSSTPSSVAGYLPVVQYDFTPTPPATPPPFPYSAAAILSVTPLQPINGSTFNTGSFILENGSLNGERISQVSIDLSTAVFPDIIFDPFGNGGDTLAKDVTVDGRVGLSFSGHDYAGERGGGYDILNLRFQSFDPGDSFTFSVDVDPNSIRGVGAPGPNEAGSICGLEMIGAAVTVTFEDGQLLTNHLYRMPEPERPCGAIAHVQAGLPVAPLVTAANPQVTTNPNYTVQIDGPPGQPVHLLVIEGGLFTEGVPGGGFNIEPFEANNALTFLEYSSALGADGRAAVPVVLSRSHPNGGLNHIIATFDNYYGIKGGVTEPLVVELGAGP